MQKRSRANTTTVMRNWVILEHQGFIPDKSEMTLITVLRILGPYSFSVRALHGGGNTQTNDSFRWLPWCMRHQSNWTWSLIYKSGPVRMGTFLVSFTKRVILGRPVGSKLSRPNGKINYWRNNPYGVTQCHTIVVFHTWIQHPTKVKNDGPANEETSHSLKMNVSCWHCLPRTISTSAERYLRRPNRESCYRSWLRIKRHGNVKDESAQLDLKPHWARLLCCIVCKQTHRNWLHASSASKTDKRAIATGDTRQTITSIQKQFSLGKINFRSK